MRLDTDNFDSFLDNNLVALAPGEVDEDSLDALVAGDDDFRDLKNVLNTRVELVHKCNLGSICRTANLDVDSACCCYNKCFLINYSDL